MAFESTFCCELLWNRGHGSQATSVIKEVSTDILLWRPQWRAAEGGDEAQGLEPADGAGRRGRWAS